MNIDSNSDLRLQNYGELDVLKAEVVYVVIRKLCYVPRSLRVQWFLQHLHTKIRITPLRDLQDENDWEAVIISVTPHEPPDYWTAADSRKYEYSVELSTNVIFLGERYRQVYCLDISPSVSTVDIQHGQVLLDVIIEALQASIRLLIKPFQIPGSSHEFTPDIFITVIAHTPFYISPAQQVLVQGWRISEDNVNEFLEAVLRQLKFIEDEVARVSGSVHEQFERERKKSIIEFQNGFQRSTERIFDENYEPTPIAPNVAMVSPGSSFLNLLRYGMLALKLLPASNFSNLIVITDGMIIMPDSDTLDSVLNHMRYNDIACYFLHVGSQFHPHCGFGFVPYTEIMQLISVATNGTYMQFQAQQKPVPHMNVYQQNFLTWSLKRKSVVSDLSTPQSRDGEWNLTNRHFYGNRSSQLIVKKYLENDISITSYGVLACRMREGFILKDIIIRDNQLVISFTLPWTNHIYIDYALSCQWPLVSAPSIPNHYVMNIRAPYEFLHDISCRQKVPIKSPFRQALIARFWRSLKSFAQSDLLLSHLESFMNNNSSYYLPESLKNGMPLYNLLPGCNQPTISSNDIGYMQFGNIWRPACLLNNNLWQKWFHADRVGVIFKHDDPLNLFPQKFELRVVKYSIGLQCRQATNTLFNFLKTYCSFVLIENHSYIKFLLPNESGTGKHSFLVIRSIVKPPYAVLHMAFLYNIPGRVRTKVLEDFKHSLENLEIPRVPATNDNYDNIFGPELYDTNTNCCILLDKPLEKILIRYEQVPKEFRTVIFPDGTQPSVKAPNAVSSNGGLITTLSRYLHHRRWIWRTSVGRSTFLPFGAVEKVLNTLIRKRLQEGFYFAHYCTGIYNMALEVQMKGARIEKEEVDGLYYEYQDETDDDERLQSCIIQYVVFSPKTFISDNDAEDNSNVKVVELVTECWIEPQHGVITDCPPVRNYMSNLQYHKLPDAIWATDAKCISALFTFDYMRLMCANSNLNVPDSVQHMLTESNSTSYWPNVAPFEDERIRQIPFAYSLPNLLCQCTQEMMLFNLFSVDVLDKNDPSAASNKLLLEFVYNHLSFVHTREVLISGQEAQYLIRNLRKSCRVQDGPSLYDSEISVRSDLASGHDWNRMASWALNEKYQYHSSTPRSSRTHSSAADTKIWKPSDTDSRQSSTFDLSVINHDLEDVDWFKWKCYVKFTPTNQCLVTVIPENLDVIKRISLDGQKEAAAVATSDVESQTESTETSVSATPLRNDSFYTAYSSSSKELTDENDEAQDRTPKETFRLRASTWDPVRGAMESSSEGADDRQRTNSVGARVPPLSRLRAKRSSDLDSTEKLSESAANVSKYMPLTLPLYVWNCTLDDVIKYLIGKNEEKPRSSFHEKKNENNLEAQCRSVTLAFRKYFILSLFKCLLEGYNIPVADVDQAFSKCDVSVVTIDITEYLKVVCRHLKNLISANVHEADKKGPKPSSYFISSNMCDELRCIHCLIKKKFVNMLTLDFKPIPSKPEFYYFSSSWSKESKPSSVGMLSPGLMENPSTGVSVEQIIPPVSVANVSALNAWETCKGSIDSDDDAATSLLSNMDSDSLNESTNHCLTDDSNPFFVHIDCKIHSENRVVGKCSLNKIPTCICDVLDRLDKPLDINVDDLRVTLDISCLTSPYAEAKKKSSKNIQTSSASKTNQFFEDLETADVCDNILDNLSFEDVKIPKQLEDLPDDQYNALNTFLAQIKWLMKDEIVTFMLDTNPVTSDTLKTVCDHVESSPHEATCFIEKVPLSFVFNQEGTSIKNFLQDFGFMKVSNYQLKKLDNMYYLIMDPTDRYKSTPRHHFEDFNTIVYSMEKLNEEQEQFSQVFSSNESMSENYRDRSGYMEYVNSRQDSITDPDDEISRGIQHTVQWILDREMSEVELPNFWLIMTVTQDVVTVYFHCRFLEFKNKKVDEYVMIRENVIQNIKDMCKVVNQKMLLDNLHDTRTCDQLLVSDPQQSEEDEVLVNVGYSNTAGFGPASFACPVVWETRFILHPRLKVSQLKGAVSRGIQALCSILSGFSVSNRKNLFVYQDNNKNVFYLRLYESIHGNSKHDSEETTSSGSFSRSSSFTSLSRKQFEEQLPFLLDETRGRNKSFSDASETNLLKGDDFITLKVYGISKAGKDVKSELVQLLQNKLDDAVLDVISVMLSRNPLCKLLSEDVHFIQKPNQLPNDVVRFSVHERAVDHLYTLRQLIRLNVQTFAYLPKYSDSRQTFHFQDYSVAEDSSKRISEHDIFLYNQPLACGKAIACFALALVDCDGEIIECVEKLRTPVHVKNKFWSLDEIKSLTATEAVNEENVVSSRIRVEFRIWKQGKLNTEVLHSKFLLAIRHALWELVTEKYLLPYPVFFPNTNYLCEVYHALMPSWMNFGTELNVSSVKEWDMSLPVRSNVNLIFRELNSMFLPHEIACYGFYKSDDSYYRPCITFDDKIQHKGETCLLVGLNLRYPQNGYENPKGISLADARAEVRLQRSPSSCQEDGPYTISKRKFILVVIADSKIKLHLYNLTKEKIETITKEMTSFSEWLEVRSYLLFSIVEQKMGLFFNLPIQRAESLQKTIDVNNASLDTLLRYPVSSKHLSGVDLNNIADAFKDFKLPENIRNKTASQSPFSHHVNQLREISKMDRKTQYKQLHQFWQRKASSSNSSVNKEMLDNFLLQGRLIHFVLSPLLFMPRWRLRTAATRDHSLSLKTQNQSDEFIPPNYDDSWHTSLCSNFVHEYKQYLHSLGFHSIQKLSEDFSNTINFKHRDDIAPSAHYMQKFLLGGVLLYELYFSEPFFNTKLYALEYARLNVKTNSLVSQFTVSFLDECDRIKFQMHLHSFTYDYHLRCLHQFITEQQALLSYGYHIVNFLNDFIKYYPKAPNFARNLVQKEFVTVNDVSISPFQLFDYLLTHRKNYDMATFTMTPEFASNDSVEDHEYVLVRNKSTSAVCYKDVNDQQQTDDFDIILIISHITSDDQESNIMAFQIYVVITSRRELYPKVESDQKIGKFRTVSTSYDYSSSNEDETDTRLSICDDSGSSKDSSLELKEPMRRKRTTNHVEIKLEPINYLGYYSSHEETMQKLMVDEMEEAKKYIQWMVTQGAFDCRTHVLWKQLLCSTPAPLNYEEFQNLLSMADVHEINSMDDQLKAILNQPISWLSSFFKAFDAKQPGHCHSFSSPNGKTQEFLILHPECPNGFMMIVLNMQTSACTMSLVYRRGFSDTEDAHSTLQTLFEQIVNNLCFHLWVDAF